MNIRLGHDKKRNLISLFICDAVSMIITIMLHHFPLWPVKISNVVTISGGVLLTVPQ